MAFSTYLMDNNYGKDFSVFGAGSGIVGLWGADGERTARLRRESGLQSRWAVITEVRPKWVARSGWN